MRRSTLRIAVSVAEIISAFAVVLTLVYAVSELKRSRALTSTSIETVLYQRMLEMDRLVAEGDGLADILVRVNQDPETLTASERVRYLAYEHIFYDGWEAAREAWQSGLMDQTQFDAWDKWFAGEAARRPQMGWTENTRNHDAEFITYIEERVTWDR